MEQKPSPVKGRLWTKDFTIIAQFRFANMAEDGAKPNFTFYPVFSAMSADMPSQAHTGNGQGL